jgi:hypothetical protein
MVRIVSEVILPVPVWDICVDSGGTADPVSINCPKSSLIWQHYIDGIGALLLMDLAA